MDQKIKKVLVLGSGALKIGEAGEFDYSGSQAIKALKEEGVKTVLVNPNIATVQTSEDFADSVYFLPINAEFVSKIIQQEHPDGILLGFGGQTALNCGVALHSKGVLKKYKVKILGTPMGAIKITENRKLFKEFLTKQKLNHPKGKVVATTREAIRVSKELGFPVIVRSGYELGGKGSGVAFDIAILQKLASRIFSSSPEMLIEEYLDGWKEIEYEIVRDRYGNCISVCNMENLDPIGIHTGESIVVAPSQTLTNDEYHSLRTIAINLINKLGIIGECNVQFALNPNSNEYRIIEVNARLSRSSALASKATGYPLAFVAAKLALGQRLSEIKNSITQATTACFEPALDYVVTKIPRWDFEKFKNSSHRLGPQMQSVGEVMAIGRNFEESLQKAVRMAEESSFGIINNKNYNFKNLKSELAEPTDKRLFAIVAALSKGWPVQRIVKLTKIDRWFIAKINNLVQFSKKIKSIRRDFSMLKEAKRLGFSDAEIGQLADLKEETVINLRKKHQIFPVVKQIDTLAGEFAAKTNYLYFTYQGTEHDIAIRKKTKKIMVLGSGAYHVGSSVEFDWCSVHAVRTLKKLGYETILINYNPETVSTDYDESDKLYFEELTPERILDIYNYEKPLGAIICMGGQIPNNLAVKLHNRGVTVLGTHPSNIDMAENRYKFSKLLETLKVEQPAWIEATNAEQINSFVKKVGYPVLIRPSYVLSGSAMAVAFNKKDVLLYIQKAARINNEHPAVISKFIFGAKEIEMDAVAAKGKIIAKAIIEHVENAGVHSGDATLVLPAQKLHVATKEKILWISQKIAETLKINGPFNIQFLAKNDNLMVIECNLRASRSLPFVSKVYKRNFIDLAIKAILGKKVAPIKEPRIPFVGVKVPQFSFSRLAEADPIITVDMASTGEVASLGETTEEAFLKALIASGFDLPKKNILLSLGGDGNKIAFLPEAKLLSLLGYTLFATKRTADFLKKHKIASMALNKPSVNEEPSVSKWIENKKIDLVINTSDIEFNEHIPDDYKMRRLATDYNVPLITNIQLAKLLVSSINKLKKSDLKCKAWQDYIIP